MADINSLKKLFAFIFLMPFSTRKQLSTVVLAVLQGRYPRTDTIQPISQLQWTDTKINSFRKLDKLFSVKKYAAVNIDQNIYYVFL